MWSVSISTSTFLRNCGYKLWLGPTHRASTIGGGRSGIALITGSRRCVSISVSIYRDDFRVTC